jgi:hypothetical protein
MTADTTHDLHTALALTTTSDLLAIRAEIALAPLAEHATATNTDGQTVTYDLSPIEAINVIDDELAERVENRDREPWDDERAAGLHDDIRAILTDPAISTARRP